MRLAFIVPGNPSDKRPTAPGFRIFFQLKPASPTQPNSNQPTNQGINISSWWVSDPGLNTHENKTHNSLKQKKIDKSPSTSFPFFWVAIEILTTPFEATILEIRVLKRLEGLLEVYPLDPLQKNPGEGSFGAAFHHVNPKNQMFTHQVVSSSHLENYLSKMGSSSPIVGMKINEKK